jgi:hypothetical protein
LTYTLESTECDGTDATVISSTTCEIPLTTLIVAPFSLELNESIYAKIVASNFYGDSSYSTAGNGALTKLVPDAPINLANDETITTDLTIRFTWSQGLSDGGVAVTDYQVYYDQGTSSFTLLADAVEDTFYQTSVALIAGTTYQFKVLAKNSIGYSLDSEVLSILASRVPDKPISLADDPLVTTAYQVGLVWSDGAYSGGTSIIDYRVSYTDDTSYSVFSDSITTTSVTVTGLTPGVTYTFYV